MDSPQSVVSPLKSSSVFRDSEKQSTNHFVENPSYTSREINFRREETTIGNSEEFLGGMEVHIHQARDIHNICIYQKQDVYAKLCLTSDPEKAVSTKIINGGGRNPVFNEKLRLTVRNVDSSLKCEIWMLSRVRNYLEDQLLGFALVPMSEILLHDGKLEKEFSLSSTDLFHSPAGFVELSITYVGAQPEVIPIPASDTVLHDNESNKSLPNEFDNIEFPDPIVLNENRQMVKEYFEICAKVDSQCSDSLVSSEIEYQVSLEVGTEQEESFSTGTGVYKPLTVESPPTSVSTTETSFASVPASYESSESPKDLKSPIVEHVSPPKDCAKEKSADGLDAESNVSSGMSSDAFAKPLVSVSIESEPKVVQQDIVDMYMKSMQQFTESLAKMKLPVDYENGPSSSENSTTEDQKTPASKKSGSRVFYGSRAFF